MVDPRLFAAVFDLPSELDVDAELDAIIQADQSGEPLTEAQVAMAARFVSAAGAARQGDGGAEEKMTLQTDWIDLVVQCRKLIV